MFLKPFSIFTFRTSQLPILHIYNFDQNWCSTTTKLQQTFVVNIFLCFRLFSLISNCRAYFYLSHFSKQISRFCYICLKGINWLILKDLLNITQNFNIVELNFIFSYSLFQKLTDHSSQIKLNLGVIVIFKMSTKNTHWLVNKLKR